MLCPFFGFQCRYAQSCTSGTNTDMLNDNKESCRSKKSFTAKEAFDIGRQIGINWNNSPFDVEQFRMGLDVELEHGRISPVTNVTNDNPVMTGKIALAHLNEFPDYYTRLNKLEAEAKAYLGK